MVVFVLALEIFSIVVNTQVMVGAIVHLSVMVINTIYDQFSSFITLKSI